MYGTEPKSIKERCCVCIFPNSFLLESIAWTVCLIHGITIRTILTVLYKKICGPNIKDANLLAEEKRKENVL